VANGSNARLQQRTACDYGFKQGARSPSSFFDFISPRFPRKLFSANSGRPLTYRNHDETFVELIHSTGCQKKVSSLHAIFNLLIYRKIDTIFRKCISLGNFNYNLAYGTMNFTWRPTANLHLEFKLFKSVQLSRGW
jgi:hypothetical protein